MTETDVLHSPTTSSDVSSGSSEAIASIFYKHPLRQRFTRRVLNEDDAPEYVLFDDRVFFDSETPTNHQPESFKAEEITRAIRSGAIIEALMNGEEMAATYWFDPQPGRRNLHIESLAVDRRYRGQGIGHYFLAAAEAEAGARGFETCDLHVDPLNSIAMALYFNSGYHARGCESSNANGLCHWLLATKTLSVPPERHDASSAVLVAAGDEDGLQQIMLKGYVGTSFQPSEAPERSIIGFQKPAR